MSDPLGGKEGDTSKLIEVLRHIVRSERHGAAYLAGLAQGAVEAWEAQSGAVDDPLGVKEVEAWKAALDLLYGERVEGVIPPMPRDPVKLHAVLAAGDALASRLEEVSEELSDIHAAYEATMREACSVEMPDGRVHCTCIPHLREGVRKLTSKVAELERERDEAVKAMSEARTAAAVFTASKEQLEAALRLLEAK